MAGHNSDAAKEVSVQLVNEFSVEAPLDAAWRALTDIPLVIGCVPGAHLDDRDGDHYQASVTVRVGPVGLTLAGDAVVVDRDDAAHRMVVQGSARDRKGNGTASATVTMVAEDGGAQSNVTVTTDLELGGRIAQFGSGVISQVSKRILKQFAEGLNASMTAADGSAEPAATARSVRRADRLRVRTASEGRTAVATLLAGVALGLALGRALAASR